MNFTKFWQEGNRKIGSALLNLALLSGSLSAGAATTGYYAARRGNYTRRNQSYLREPGLGDVSQDLFDYRQIGSSDTHDKAYGEATDVVMQSRSATRELVIVDRNVKDYHLFSAFIRPGVEVVEIPKQADGLESLLTILAQYHGLTAVHLVSHASAGKLYLGNTVLDRKSVLDRLETFSIINKAMAPGADLLMYGCELAKDDEGGDFLQIIKGNTHIDVAASDDRTGNLAYGGDWDLEIHQGDINAVPLGDSPALVDFSSILQVTFSMNGAQIVNSGNFTGSANNASVHENGGTTHTLIFDGKDSGTKATGNYIYVGGTYLVYETQVRMYLSGNSPFQPGSLKFFTSIPRIFTVTSNAGGSVNFTLGVNSATTVDLSGLPATTTVLTLTATGNFAGYIDNVVFTSIGSTVTAPAVTTTAAASVAGTSATLGGNVTSDGGASVTERGIVYSSTDTDPNIGDAGVIKDTNGTGTGSFSESITGLSSATTYYFKAYATNTQGTGYGVVRNFTTLDVTPPAVSSITLSGSPLATASSVSFVVAFNESANNISVDDFQLTGTGTASGSISAVSASSGSSVTVTVSSISGTGTLRLDLKGSTNITDAAGNGNGTNGFVAAYTSGSTHTVDRDAPTVSNVTSTTANNTYKTGDNIAVTVTFSEAVTVTGTPQLQLETGATDRTVNYASGSGTATLTFIYTIQSGDVSSDLDYTGTGALTLNGGTIKDAAGNNATLTLASPGAPGSLGANKSLVVDGVVPTVTSVSSTTANGTYKVGDVIAVTVTFSEVVNVIGTPQLQLETGTVDRTINYASGTNSATLTFNYTIQSGDVSTDLDYTGTGALTLNGGSIRDGAGNNATLTLASPGTAGSLGGNKALVIDGIIPTVTNVTSTTANGTYKAGNAITVTVTFSEVVNVTGTPQLQLETGATDRTINYASGSGSATLTFSYTIQSGDVSTDLDYTGTGALTLNSGTINDGAGNSATLTLPAPGAAGSLGANKALVVDGVAPTVSNVSASTTNGTYKTGDVINVTVTFSEAVTVTGTPQLQLETGAVDRTINYASGGGSTILNFTYTIQAGDSNLDLDYTGTGALTLNGGAITDAIGNAATLTLPTPGAAGSLGANKALVVDGVVPTVSSVSSTTANGSYKIGDVVAITITFSETVNVTGTPQLQLETGAVDRTINYASGSGSATLIFNYTIQSGDISSDLDYTGTGALTLNSGFIRDAASNNATLTLASPGTAGSLGANKSLVVDGVVPTVSNVTSTTANGTYTVGDVIAVTVTFSEVVNVTGTPQLQLETGTTDRTINYASGSGSTTLVFNYTVQSGDISSDLDYTGTGALTLNAGTIKDGAGNNATLTLASPGTAGSLAANKALVIDGVVPTVTNVTATTANGTYGPGDVISITISFSENVTVTGTPLLTLETGTTDRVVNYVLGSGSSTLTFAYTIQAGDVSTDLDYTGTGSLTLNGGTIKDGTGGNAALTLPSPGSAGSLGANKAIVVDGVAPTVTNVSSSTANGTYKPGDVIAVTVTFSEVVTVTGTPRVQLETGTTDQTINYTSGSGTTTLTFSYTVQTGDASADLDYTATSALTLNGGTIADGVGNAATLTLPTPGAAGSLAANKALVIDGVAPTVSTVSSSTANGTYKVGDVVAITITFSETVVVTGTPQLQLETGTTDRTINYASGTGSTTLTFNYTIQANDESTDLDYISTTALALNGGTITDAVGNAATLTLPSPGAAGSLGANKALVIDGVVPVVSSVSSSTADGTYKVGDVIAVTVTFSEPVVVTGTPRIQLETGTVDRQVNYVSGSNSATLTFNYTIQSGDASTDLDYVGTTALTLNSGTIKDAAGNTATLTLATPGTSGSLGSAKAFVVDGVAPTISTLSPADGATGVSAGTTLDVTFSEAVSAGTGNITIRKSSDNSVVQTIAVTAGSVSFAGDGVSITPATLPSNTALYIQIDNGAVLDAAGNSFSGISNTTTWNFTTVDQASMTINDPTVTEGNSGTVAMTFTVTMSKATAGTVTVDYATSDGTATAGSDYVATSGTLTFGAGETSKTIAVNINGDQIMEPTETLLITLSNLTGVDVALTDASGTGSITDDDQATLTIADVSRNEDDGTATVVVTLNQGVQGGFTVQASTTDGTATAGSDYVAVSNQLLTFAGNDQEKQSFTITLTADGVVEPDEQLTVSLQNLANTTLAVDISDVATVTLVNDDAAPVVTASQNFTIAEDATAETLVGTVQATDADNDALSAWTIVSGNNAGLFTLEAATGKITFAGGAKLNVGDQYTLGITVSDGSNTSQSVSVTITVIESGPQEILVPEGLSPNGDGANDTWIIDGIEKYPANKVAIFNRWGNVVYEVSGYNNTSVVFNGSSNRSFNLGSILPDGTYYYVIQLEGQATKKGYLIINQ